MALRDSYDIFMPIKMVAFQMTAFTHERRIDILSTLEKGAMEMRGLSIATQISPPSLYRHVKKLEARNYVSYQNQSVELCAPSNRLSRTLLQAALS